LVRPAPIGYSVFVLGIQVCPTLQVGAAWITILFEKAFAGFGDFDSFESGAGAPFPFRIAV